MVLSKATLSRLSERASTEIRGLTRNILDKFRPIIEDTRKRKEKFLRFRRKKCQFGVEPGFALLALYIALLSITDDHPPTQNFSAKNLDR